MPRHSLRASTLHYRVSFILLTVGIYLLFFSQLISSFTTHTTSPNDAPLIMWLIHQSSHFFTNSGDLYNWPMFHPYANTATFSDPFLSLGLLTIPIHYFVENIVAQHNALILISSITTFISMYLLAKTIWKTTLIAWITAVVFSFSFLYLQFAVHLHTFFIAGLPISLLALIKYREARKLQYLVLFAVAFLAQALNAPQTAYFTGAILLGYAVSEHIFLDLLKDKYIQMLAVFVLAVCFWFYTPYIITAEAFNAQRTIRDTAHFSFSITRLVWIDVLFPVLLLGTGVLFSNIRSAKKTPLRTRTWIIISLIGLFCMLGPVVKFEDETVKIAGIPLPLPYAVIYYVVPGISAFRAVTRWAVVLNFGLSLGVGWLLYQTKLKLRVILVLLICWVVAMWFLFQQKIALYFIPAEVPSIYEAVQRTDGKVLAEMPIIQWDMSPFDGIEHRRLLYQLQHKKALYNGVSGFMPQQRAAEIYEHFIYFPDEVSLNILKKNGVELVLVHFDEYQQMEEQQLVYGNEKSIPLTQLISNLENQKRLELITCTNVPFDCLYQLK